MLSGRSYTNLQYMDMACYNRAMKNKKLQFTSVVWKEGKYYVVQCLNVDVSSFGKTKADALRNLEEALELYFEDSPRPAQKIRSPSIVVRELQYA